MTSQQDAFGTKRTSVTSVNDSGSNEILPRPGEAGYQIPDQHQAADCAEGGCPVAQSVRMASRPCPGQENQDCC